MGFVKKTLIQDETGLAIGVGKRPLLRLKPGKSDRMEAKPSWAAGPGK